MADYRAKNRSDKGLDVARIRAAAKLSTPVPRTPTMPILSVARDEEIKRQMYAAGFVQNEMGGWYDPDPSPTAQRIATAESYSPTSAARDFYRGVKGFSTLNYNPEGREYPDKMVPSGVAGMPAFKQEGRTPNFIDSISTLPGIIGRSIMAPEKTDVEKKLWEQARGNPYEYRKLLKGLNPQQKSQNSIDAQINSNEKEYNDMVSMLKDTGISEEEMYRGVVVSPDGQVNLNANVRAALEGIGYAADTLRGAELIGYGLGKPIGLAARAATKSVIPRAVGLATNPRVINAGMTGLEILQRGGRPTEAVLGSVASMVAGNKPVSNAVLRLTPEEHALILAEKLEAKAPRGGGRGLAATKASNVQSAQRRPPAGSGEGRIPVDEMTVKFTAEDEVRIVEENAEIMNDNAEYIGLYRASRQGNNKPGSIYIHAHPPGMNPSEVRNVLPDHLTSGPLNDLETKVNGARRAEGRDPLTNYTDIITEGIALAKGGKFKEGTWNAKLADMTLEEAQVYLGANGVKYW